MPWWVVRFWATFSWLASVTKKQLEMPITRLTSNYKKKTPVSPYSTLSCLSPSPRLGRTRFTGVMDKRNGPKREGGWLNTTQQQLRLH